MSMYKALSTLAILLGIVLLPSTTEASSFVLENKTITVEAGKTFTLPVTVAPGAGEKLYTAKLALDFSPEMLEVVSFTFKPSWLSVSQPGYDSVDNPRGEMIKTAGFPKGFSSSVSFGTVTFRAKSVGEDVISVGPRSLILDATNKDTLTSREQARVTVRAASSLPQSAPAKPAEDPNLFDISHSPEIQTAGVGLVSRVAPGEFLTFSVKLLNFGNKNKVDVGLSYNVTDSEGKVIYHAEETVAVETTASFVKTIQIPYETKPGRYVVRSFITYKDQVAPAQTEFPFTVEDKVLGLFLSDFTLYGGTTVTLSILSVLGYTLFRRYKKETRFAPFAYANVPSDVRIFYEILSDTIMGMRQRVGDDALFVASQIEGLKIDISTGRVLSVGENPSKIIASLVYEYEKLLGKKVSFSLRPESIAA